MEKYKFQIYTRKTGAIKTMSNQERLKLFDNWAEDYDPSNDTAEYPFTGYDNVLDGIATIVNQEKPKKVLDLGTGTGNLLKRFDSETIELWGTDFPPEMITKAEQTFKNVQFLELDVLSDSIPDVLPTDFDFIVSAYVLHEFPLEDKAKILKRYSQHLSKDGVFIIGDIAFETVAQRETAQRTFKNWDPSESPWAADESQAIFDTLELTNHYKQISNCAGIYVINF